jgi:hypothetical protein
MGRNGLDARELEIEDDAVEQGLDARELALEDDGVG